MPIRFTHLTIFGFSIYVALGDRLVDHSEGASVATKWLGGTLFLYLGPLHMILERA